MNTPKITPEEIGIIKDAKAGKESAFNTIYYKYKEFVISLLYQYLNDMDEAKDLSNIVFLKYIKNFQNSQTILRLEDG